MKRIYLVGVVLLPISLARAEWVNIGKGDSDAKIFVESKTIQENGNFVKMWDLADYAAVQTASGKKYLSTKMQIEYDCANKMTRVLFISIYAGNMGSGELVKAVNIPKGTDWSPNPPDSVNDGKWKIACKDSKVRGRNQ